MYKLYSKEYVNGNWVLELDELMTIKSALRYLASDEVILAGAFKIVTEEGNIAMVLDMRAAIYQDRTLTSKAIVTGPAH